MAIDRKEDPKADNEKTPSQTQSTTPSGLPETPWIMHSLNQIQEQIGRVEGRIQERINGIQEQINGLEKRLRRFERLFRTGQGILIAVLVIWAVVQFLVSNYHISFTPNP